MESPRIQLRPGSIWIDRQPVILFTSSLFYFRIAAEEWRNRMRTLVRLGYNAIDVYFPWNYHEPAPGTWVFEGQRDVSAFLRLAREEGLLVIARPGPYICSEWDGGALPAHLKVDPDLGLRDANPAYLAAACAWYDQILPILAGFQIDQGGTIIMLQLENELDFFDCQDRAGMMSALRDKAYEHGITVPLIACAGQGDLAGATGNVDNVMPACNVYFDSRDLELEPRVRHYYRRLVERGYPLCIIETNRAHLDLRRLLVSGAKLLGPYLQVGGTDFGFTTGVTNWGDPLAFLTSHYDFGGMLSPGGVVRSEGLEARLLTRLLAALGPAAALAKPVEEVPLRVSGAVVPSAMALDGGGWLLSLANLGDEPAQVTIGEGAQRFPCKVELKIPAMRCPFVLYELPLEAWGVAGQLGYATAELAARTELADGLELSFVAAGSTEISLRLAGAELGENAGWNVEHAGGAWRAWLTDAATATLEFRLPGGRRLRLRAVDRETAAGFSLAEVNSARPGEVQAVALNWQVEAVDACAEAWFAAAEAAVPGALHLEQNGIYRGYGWYRHPGLAREPKGLLVRAGADVLSVYAGSQYLGSLAPAGMDAFLPWQPGAGLSADSSLVVRAEIWGHPNFDDGRLPALRLNSLRGMGGLAAVWTMTSLTPNWFYQDGAQAPAAAVDLAWTCLDFGGWSTTKEPAPGVYYRAVQFDNEGDTRILHFPKTQVNIGVYVNQQWAGEATPFNPWLDLSQMTRPGEKTQLALFVDRRLRLSTGPVILFQGQALHDWALAGWGEADFARLAVRLPGTPAGLPFRLAAGKMAWLHTQLPAEIAAIEGLCMVFEGKGLKVSAWLGERLVGRLWLPSQLRPRMAGGPDDRFNLPAAWMKAVGGMLHLLVESVGEDGELEKAELVVEE